GLCIADEVQAGFGRTGTHYWGFETQDVLPDIVTMAKGIGNGCPLGAVVTTPKIAAALAQRTHFNTCGGNPVVCSQGSAVVALISGMTIGVSPPMCVSEQAAAAVPAVVVRAVADAWRLDSNLRASEVGLICCSFDDSSFHSAHPARRRVGLLFLATAGADGG